MHPASSCYSLPLSKTCLSKTYTYFNSDPAKVEFDCDNNIDDILVPSNVGFDFNKTIYDILVSAKVGFDCANNIFDIHLLANVEFDHDKNIHDNLVPCHG